MELCNLLWFTEKLIVVFRAHLQTSIWIRGAWILSKLSRSWFFSIIPFSWKNSGRFLKEAGIIQATGKCTGNWSLWIVRVVLVFERMSRGGAVLSTVGCRPLILNFIRCDYCLFKIYIEAVQNISRLKIKKKHWILIFKILVDVIGIAAAEQLHCVVVGKPALERGWKV